jgi:hypothetical protein
VPIARNVDIKSGAIFPVIAQALGIAPTKEGK